MYLKFINIKNIRSIESFEMDFKDSAAGWHVLLGDNGAGKSTIVKAIALALIGPDSFGSLRQDWREWLQNDASKGSILLKIIQDSSFDLVSAKGNTASNNTITAKVEFERNGTVAVKNNMGSESKSEISPKRFNWGTGSGWFSAAFGPYRRFAGGNLEKERVFYTDPKAGAHLSVFGEDIALSEASRFLIDLHIKKLEDKPEGKYLEHIITFINKSELLPHHSTIKHVNSDGIFCIDGNEQEVVALQLSDGLRSILSLAFELIRQLIRVYGEEKVFTNIRLGKNEIDLPGVVLIDEIDVHLHPTWQVRIGQWFTSHFPKIQFIVTTHSPLICRASENGSIWRLTAPGSGMKSGKVSDIDKNKLMYGNVLDALSTELFGQNIEKSEAGIAKSKRLALLANKEAYNAKQLNADEKIEINELRKALMTDATIEL
jgi:predicted ATP-binding protein involved in virulence